MAVCTRCYGKGQVLVRYGVPGQDPHTPYSEIVWQDEGYWRECRVCIGTGYPAPPRKQRPERGMLALHASDKLLTRALNQLPETGTK